ncbi:MAG TPA: hypothetical protein VMW43_03410 [Bacteroidota bacterium]|nr:hypothetical protein [Bacteroidota bacterium]
MSYTMDVEAKGNYLHITVRGINSPQNVRNYLAEVRQKCIDHRTSAVLIEESLSGPGLPSLDIFNIVRDASKNIHPVIRRIAYVDTNTEHSLRELKFGETVAVNRGVNVKVFSTVAEGEKWLKGLAEFTG